MYQVPQQTLGSFYVSAFLHGCGKMSSLNKMKGAMKLACLFYSCSVIDL